MKKQTAFVLTAYLGLTILMTWPIAAHLGGAIPGDGFDGWQNYWNLWWVKEALLVLGTNPFFTHYLDAPNGVSLLFHTLNIFNGLWSLPLQLNFGLAIAYNSIVFVGFVLAGYGGYLLSLHTLNRLDVAAPGQRRWAAFVGGLIFTISPFHMAHLLGHMQVFTLIWPPFYILWLLRALEGRPRPRSIALACLGLILASLVNWYHTLYLVIFTGVACLWQLVRRRQWTPLGVGAAIGLGYGLVLSPLLLPMMRQAGQRPDLETGLAQNIALSADLLAFITPSEMHPLWGDWARTIAQNFTATTSERLIFVGFTPLALALWGLIRGWSRSAIKFWGLILLLFLILALGPYLHINGRTVLPMPYLLLYHTIPFIDLTRSLSRYTLVIMLGLGVLAAVGLAYLQAGRVRFAAGPLLAALLICFEFLAAPYPYSPIQIPAFYHQIATDPADYTIAELPMDWDRPTPLLHQTVHGKRLLTAYTSRRNPLELARLTPVLQQWRFLGPGIIDQPAAEIAPTIFYDFHLRYIVLDYWQMPTPAEQERNERFVLAAMPGAAPIYADGRLKVYQSPPQEESRPYLSLGRGWGPRQTDAGGPYRRLSTAAELYLHHPQERLFRLDITADGPFHLLLAGQLVDPARLPPQNADSVRLILQSDEPVIVRRIGLSERGGE